MTVRKSIGNIPQRELYLIGRYFEEIQNSNTQLSLFKLSGWHGLNLESLILEILQIKIKFFSKIFLANTTIMLCIKVIHEKNMGFVDDTRNFFNRYFINI